MLAETTTGEHAPKCRQFPHIWARGIGWALLLLTAAPWGADGPITGLTGTVKTLGLVLAVGIALQERRRPTRLGVGWLFIVYAFVAAIGAFITDESLNDSLVRSARLVLVVLAAIWLASDWTLQDLLRLTATVGAIVSASALVGSVSGVADRHADRLTGWLPPLGPNSLGAVAGIGATIVAALWLRGDMRSPVAATSFGTMTLALIQTQSRTAVLATGVGLTIAIALGKKQRSGPTAYAVAVAGCAAALWGINPTAGTRFQWDSTFSGRTTGWDSVASLDREMSRTAFGDGLAAKYVADSSVFGGVRPVDGTWHSAYLEAGVIGLALLGTAVLLVVLSATRNDIRPLVVPVLGFLIVGAILESTLNDVTYPFVVLAGIAGLATQTSSLANRRDLPGRVPTPPPGPLVGSTAVTWGISAGLLSATVTVIVLRLTS